MLIYRIGDWLRGWHVFDCLTELERMEAFTAAELTAFQTKHVADLVGRAYENVPNYRRLWEASPKAKMLKQGVDALPDLPITTKKLLMEAGDDALDQSMRKSSFVVGRSSGSTGTRFVYYKTKLHQSWVIATNLLSWKWAGWRPGDRWVRLQFRGPLSLRARVEDWVFKCMNMEIDQFDEAFMLSALEKAVRLKPILFRGYAGGTYIFAKWLVERGEERLRPKALVLTGDTLYPHYRDTIERAFRAPIFDGYGGEGITAAIQCVHGIYHIPPIVHVDLIPEGPPHEDGQPHRMILTSLTNSAMPFIRYDIGDLAIPADGLCSCGRIWPGLKRIIGRDTDIVRVPSGRALVVHHFNNIIRMFDGIDQFQVHQKASDLVRIALVTNARFNHTSDERELRSQFHQLLGAGARVELDYLEEIPVPPTGKLRYIISEVLTHESETNR